ncbi:MAG: response regulator [Gallionellaceae bacterium]
MLSAYLAHYGSDHGETMDIRVLPDAQQALPVLLDQDNPGDVVFLDVRLPELGGDNVYSCLMAEKPEKSGRIVFITGYRDDLIARFPALKLNILDKPFCYRQLLDALADELFELACVI